tara:strand:- start:237 stop:344 length:108 start_codon:yes stop_codon:yes gene_type:complete
LSEALGQKPELDDFREITAKVKREWVFSVELRQTQ